jgi:hypothetical protein
MNPSLEIHGIPQRETLPDKRRDALVKKVGDMLPTTPATVICYGRIGSGKSSIMYSWLKNLFPKYYDEAIIFCASSDSKEAFEKLPQKSITFLTDYDDGAFCAYIEQLKVDQLERMESGKEPLNIFIGFDDVVFTEAIGGRKPSMVEKLMLICRHELNATVFICVQHSKQVNPAMRNNTLYHIICGVQRNDLEKISAEHSCFLTEEAFIDMYNKIQAKGKHQFIVVDYKAPEDKRFRHNFNKIISFNSTDKLNELSEAR